jgi:uncharacterized surface protein with fasciclin (FAS1) repeats
MRSLRIELKALPQGALALAASLLIGGAALANPMVGGAKMYPSKTIVDNAVHSKVHTTLVAAVKAAGLVDTLEGAGPFTVFAPVNAAFAKLPPGEVQTLLKPENKDQLSKILTYHVVAGKLTAEELRKDAEAHNGVATLTTVQGEQLQVRPKGSNLELVDSKGDKAMITTADVMQSNGVIHVINRVLLP